MTIIEQIKAEIERRIKKYATDVTMPLEVLGKVILELKGIISFLSTLESEKPIDPETAMKELDEKIALVKQRGTWDGVDVDKYMDEVRGREPEKPVPADLEEAANEYAYGGMPDEMKPYVKPVGDEVIKNFIAGAKWQKQHDAELIEIAYNDGVTIGMTKQKEQMMKEAVEGTVDYVYDEKGDAYKAIRLDRLVGDFGDKAKLYIVKED